MWKRQLSFGKRKIASFDLDCAYVIALGATAERMKKKSNFHNDVVALVAGGSTQHLHHNNQARRTIFGHKAFKED